MNLITSTSERDIQHSLNMLSVSLPCRQLLLSHHVGIEKQRVKYYVSLITLKPIWIDNHEMVQNSKLIRDLLCYQIVNQSHLFFE